MRLTILLFRSSLVTNLCMCECAHLAMSDSLWPQRHLPGSSVHGIFQARILEWVAITYFRGSSQPSDWTGISWVSCIWNHWTTWEVQSTYSLPKLSLWCFQQIHLNTNHFGTLYLMFKSEYLNRELLYMSKLINIYWDSIKRTINSFSFLELGTHLVSGTTLWNGMCKMEWALFSATFICRKESLQFSRKGD